MKIFLLITLIFLLLKFSNSTECKKHSNQTVVESEKLNMTVFIESLCIYSKNFINEQLLPIYDDFKDLIHINFITFALSESHITDNGEVETKCYHGKPECKLDLFQTCSLYVYRNDSKFQHKIIFCTMRPKRYFKACIKELNLDMEKIQNCTQGETGKYLTLWSQKESSAVIKELNGVPAVIFNGIIDAVVAEKAITQLKRVLKTKLHLPKDQNRPSDKK